MFQTSCEGELPFITVYGGMGLWTGMYRLLLFTDRRKGTVFNRQVGKCECPQQVDIHLTNPSPAEGWWQRVSDVAVQWSTFVGLVDSIVVNIVVTEKSTLEGRRSQVVLSSRLTLSLMSSVVWYHRTLSCLWTRRCHRRVVSVKNLLPYRYWDI